MMTANESPGSPTGCRKITIFRGVSDEGKMGPIQHREDDAMIGMLLDRFAWDQAKVVEILPHLPPDVGRAAGTAPAEKPKGARA